MPTPNTPIVPASGTQLSLLHGAVTRAESGIVLRLHSPVMEEFFRGLSEQLRAATGSAGSAAAPGWNNLRHYKIDFASLNVSSGFFDFSSPRLIADNAINLAPLAFVGLGTGDRETGGISLPVRTPASSRMLEQYRTGLRDAVTNLYLEHLSSYNASLDVTVTVV